MFEAFVIATAAGLFLSVDQIVFDDVNGHTSDVQGAPPSNRPVS